MGLRPKELWGRFTWQGRQPLQVRRGQHPRRRDRDPVRARSLAASLDRCRMNPRREQTAYVASIVALAGSLLLAVWRR